MPSGLEPVRVEVEEGEDQDEEQDATIYTRPRQNREPCQEEDDVDRRGIRAGRSISGARVISQLGGGSQEDEY